MNQRTVTQLAPFVIPPGPTDLDAGDEAYLHLCHNGESVFFEWVRASESPAFANVKSGQICRWVMTLTSDTRLLPAHGRIKLVFDDSMEPVIKGEPRHRTWDWSEWVPYRPSGQPNGTLESLPPEVTMS